MKRNPKALWASCQKYLHENIDADEYERLFSRVTMEAFYVATNTLVLQAPSHYIVVEIETRHLDKMRCAIVNTFGNIQLKWRVLIVNDEIKGTPQSKGILVEGIDERPMAPTDSPSEADEKSGKLRVAPGTFQTADLPPIDSQLNPTQTFRTFVEGDSNKLSCSVGRSIAEHPQTSQFNPMLVFGPSGCGKTHLVNAIGNRCKELYQQKRVLYVSARIFQLQYTTANKAGEINNFISFYQTVDMLIVDDIQEWATAKSTQDTFFHIFNHLFRNGKRIILVCDRPPVELQGMNHRLLTRFTGGLMAEMEKPNLQLCIDILKRKIARDGIKLSSEVIEYIAQTANGSVRDLEGIVNSLMAYSVVYNTNIDLSLAERVVGRAVKIDNEPLTIDDIVNRVCRYYEVTPNAVKGRSRKHEVVLPRQISMYLAQKYTKIPATRIGKLIGSRDHSTVIYSISLIEKKIKEDKAFAAKMHDIEEALKVKG